MNGEPLRTTVAKTFQLIYRSRDCIPAEEREDELGDLFARARSNNERRNITGALLLSGQWFVQVLEGEEADVRSLFATIQGDPRHDGVELLFEGLTDTRTFAHWSMAKVAMPESDIPLIAHLSEIAPASSHRMTPAMVRTLDIMRDAVDQGPVA
ncbi:MAG: BLUF domain-containing protein [Actinomycetota bacterium]|nr:BLUF domain-containing protein [Actinomycetota bacterium]